jgi:hypothetical protein
MCLNARPYGNVFKNIPQLKSIHRDQYSATSPQGAIIDTMVHWSNEALWGEVQHAKSQKSVYNTDLCTWIKATLLKSMFEDSKALT